MKIRLLPQAQEDLDEIVELALSKIVKRLDALRRYPTLGAVMTGPYAGYRSTVAGIFRIVYKQALADTLFIAYIRHCRRGADIVKK